MTAYEDKISIKLICCLFKLDLSMTSFEKPPAEGNVMKVVGTPADKLKFVLAPSIICKLPFHAHD